MNHFTVREKQVGTMVMINNEIVGCDCFGKHDSLKKTFSKLVKSYVLDAMDADTNRKKALSSHQKASSFMDAMRKCLVNKRPSICLGTDVRLVSQKVIGSALSVDEEILHLTAFARDEKDTRKRTAFYQRASRRKRD
jgi:uncharacterized UPF0160 family protein